MSVRVSVGKKARENCQLGLLLYTLVLPCFLLLLLLLLLPMHNSCVHAAASVNETNDDSFYVLNNTG